jgi:hypothetical protein
MPLRVDVEDREPDVELPRPRPERIANLEFFLAHDAPAVRRHRLDRPALRDAASRIVPAAGATSPTTVFARRCAHALAEEPGRPVAAGGGVPGGRSGFVLRPAAFAARLHDVLACAPARLPATQPGADR